MQRAPVVLGQAPEAERASRQVQLSSRRRLPSLLTRASAVYSSSASGEQQDVLASTSNDHKRAR